MKVAHYHRLVIDLRDSTMAELERGMKKAVEAPDNATCNIYLDEPRMVIVWETEEEDA